MDWTNAITPSKSALLRAHPGERRALGLLLSGRVQAALRQHLADSEAEAARVVSLDPPRVAAFARHLDTVVLLDVPPALAKGLQEGQELLALNRYVPVAQGFADDLDPGKGNRGLHGDVRTLIADLLCTPGRPLDAARAGVSADERERCGRIAEAVLKREPLRTRPLASWLGDVQPSANAPGPSVMESDPMVDPRRRRGRRRRRIALALLLSPLVGFLALFVTAKVVLRHVPYAIPPALRVPEALETAGVETALGLGLRLRYLGISGYEVSDGRTTILIDPVLTRPTVNDLVSGPLAPDESLYETWEIRRADFVLVDHAHFDHALDAAALAKRTGAVVVGTQSVLNLCASRGIPPDKLRLAKDGDVLTLGTFKVKVVGGRHGPLFGMDGLMEGTIPPNAGPLWFWGYLQDGVLSYHLQAAGTSVWFNSGSRYKDDGFDLPARTMIMGIAGNNPASDDDLRKALERIAPQRVIFTHFDNFFQPLDRGLSLLPGVDPAALRARLVGLQPDLEVFLLDYGQRIFLPPDPSRQPPGKPAESGTRRR